MNGRPVATTGLPSSRQGLVLWRFFLWPPSWLLVASALTMAAYWTGLSGPLLLDDPPNLEPLLTWLRGDNSWHWALLSNHSGPLGRPLSMLSFMANFTLNGDSIFALKLTNLLIHLACGVLIYALLVRLLRRDPRFATNADWVAVAIAATWLLHPMQVSTVLYVVQRMAQLSALFSLLALLAYVHGRKLSEAGHSRASLLWMWLAGPLFALLAALSKETGVLVPLLWLAIEIGYFSRTRPRPLATKVFFIASIGIPAAVAMLWLAHDPSRLLTGYQMRDFTLGERLLTEARVMLSYAQSILVPGGRNLGIYTDDYPVSHGLLTPWTTLPAVLFWLALVATTAWNWQRWPTFATGVFLFLGGHALESTIFPLELYFEHRNYLPMMGFLLALAGLLQPALSSMHSARLRRVFVAAFGILMLLLGLATHARAWIWRYETVLTDQSLIAHPHSLRARMDHASQLLNGGQLQRAVPILDAMITGTDRDEQLLGGVYRIAADCFIVHDADPARLDPLRKLIPDQRRLRTSQMLNTLAVLVQGGRCGRLKDADLARFVQQFARVVATTSPPRPDWRLHYQAADLFARAGILDQAEYEAETATKLSDADVATGQLWVTVLMAEHKYTQAEAALAILDARVPHYDLQGRATIRNLSASLRASHAAADTQRVH